ncbi:hypothetical protein C2S53_017474 [Perilla frutescens var. hirtella]|uniref:Uncharacterized protein n=1 Tax=Perilla frutescens var. hirtella TaxID=608512 RepID=A0AAD4IM79_PERFH|nr:hypothetical protein C2S53_017474 [Perilla frutescens var. hirtella]
MPRCLKWSFPTRHINFNFVHFFKQEIGCSVTLEPTDEEQSRLYWLSLQTPQRATAAASDDTTSVGMSLQQPSRSQRTLVVESPTPSARHPRRTPKRTRVPTPLSSSSGEEQDHFTELKERLIESVVERLMPQMEKWMDQNTPAAKQNMNISRMNPSGSSNENDDNDDSLNNELELNDYKEVSYKLFQYKTCRLRGSNGELRCPFCDNYEEHTYFHLLLHAVRVAEVSKIGKKKANHLAMAKFLAIDLADEVIKAD